MVVAIVVTFNASKWIDKCFGSLLSSTTPVSVIAVDNGSLDGTTDLIRQKYPSVEIIENGENLGFGKANNIGLKWALERNSDFVFLLNQDAWIDPIVIGKMVLVYQQNKQYGILSPLHFSGDKTYLDNYFSTYINGFSCQGIISDALSGRKLREVYEISFVNAAFWLITRAVIEKVGGFDPLFFMYGEDVDYIQRVKFHGFKIGICPSALGYHDRPQKINDTNKWTIERFFSSKLNELKNPAKELPSKYSFLKASFKLKIKKLLTGKNFEKQLLLNKKIISQYPQIKNHQKLCKVSSPTFLND